MGPGALQALGIEIRSGHSHTAKRSRRFSASFTRGGTTGRLPRAAHTSGQRNSNRNPLRCEVHPRLQVPSSVRPLNRTSRQSPERVAHSLPR